MPTKSLTTPEKTGLNVMTSPDVILVANERRETWCSSGYKYPCVHHVQTVVGNPRLNS